MSKKIFSIGQKDQLEQLVFSFSDLIGVDEAGRGCLAGPVDSAGRESSGLGMESTMAPTSATAPEIWW